jgi:hypothetical protein
MRTVTGHRNIHRLRNVHRGSARRHCRLFRLGTTADGIKVFTHVNKGKVYDRTGRR